MPKIPNQNLIEQAVEHSYSIDAPLRPYLGYSIFANPCANYLWHTFRWTYKVQISPRVQRLFNRGHQEEPIIVADLERAGMPCRNVTQNQIEVVGFMGHLKGHPDGDIINVPGAEKTEHNLEMKTAKDKKFKEFVKFGVQRSNPQYYGQSLAYMHHKKQTRTLFVITNKDTDYRHYERLHHDEEEFQRLEERACDIILSPVPMKKISERPEWHVCRYCNAANVCHGNAQPLKGCRTCQHSVLHPKGEWHCTEYPGNPIPVDFQRVGCEDRYKPFL